MIRSKFLHDSKYGIPQVLHDGEFYNENNDLVKYYITYKYTISLESYMIKNPDIDASQSFEITIQLLDILQKIHISGYTYNDLKPENIMLCNDA
jgi:serine/threonine protein kinase